MDLVKRVKELEGRLLEVVSASAVKFKELEEELSHANGKLNSIQDACSQAIDDSEEARQLHNTGTAVEDIIERLSSSATALYSKGRTEMAEEILNLVKKKEEEE